jgi:hypothetical protein
MHSNYKVISNLTYGTILEERHAYIIVIRYPRLDWERPLENTSCCSEKKNIASVVIWLI